MANLPTIRKTKQRPLHRNQLQKKTVIPFIPTEAELDSLISASRQHTATLYQTLKETGARIGELTNLQWTDIDTERRTVNIKPEKNSNGRILPISQKLSAMLDSLPHKTDKVFGTATYHGHRTTFEQLRDRTAKKLGNPRIKKITFHTFRHWKGTMEYHKTKDIIHVKNVLGHKSIESTMIYINIEQALFLEQTDEYTCMIAKTVEEATKLIEAGFEYVTDLDGTKLFKKRK